MNANYKEDILRTLRNEQPIYLATSMDNQPFLRPVTLMHLEGRFYIATGSMDAKVKQLAANPLVQICVPMVEGKFSGYIRVSGQMLTVTDNGERKEVFDKSTYIGNYWESSTDPDFQLYSMSWQQVEYLKPGDQYPARFEW